MNTKIEYLYRDASNNKVWNTAIVSGELTAEQKAAILDSLNEGEHFIPAAVGLSATDFVELGYAYDEQDDHPWFELGEYSFEETDAAPTVDITTAQLTENFVRCKGNWPQT